MTVTDTAVAVTTRTRRTFAIISHPDAGKTTLTEKLLLFGGAIHLAGEVKARGQNRRARSDWMKIEQQRGISVTSSVMTFERDGLTFNLLDTPGHEDFSEDTYRTLTAVDSAVMVIDAARGIEAQTRKLFEVCRLRNGADHHLRQQGGPRGARPLRADGRDRRPASQLDVSPDELARGHGRPVRGDLRSGAEPAACAPRQGGRARVRG